MRIKSSFGLARIIALQKYFSKQVKREDGAGYGSGMGSTVTEPPRQPSTVTLPLPSGALLHIPYLAPRPVIFV